MGGVLVACGGDDEDEDVGAIGETGFKSGLEGNGGLSPFFLSFLALSGITNPSTITITQR